MLIKIPKLIAEEIQFKMHVILEDHIREFVHDPDERLHGRAFAAEKVRKALSGPIGRNGCVIDIGAAEGAVLATEAHNAWYIGRGSLEDTEMPPSERALFLRSFGRSWLCETKLSRRLVKILVNRMLVGGNQGTGKQVRGEIGHRPVAPVRHPIFLNWE